MRFPIGHGFEATEVRLVQPPFDPPTDAGGEFIFKTKRNQIHKLILFRLNQVMSQGRKDVNWSKILGGSTSVDGQVVGQNAPVTALSCWQRDQFARIAEND